MFTRILMAATFCLLYAAGASAQPLKPVLDGPWWPIAGNPDLGPLTTAKQQPVDFAIWQAADGAWQVWSCIRHTAEPGKTRLLYRWEGAKLADENWRPMGIAMQADPMVGEIPGGLQAPYVIRRDDGSFNMFYGDWQDICLATSPADDGKKFTRTLFRGLVGLFGEGARGNARDPMILRDGSRWICYYSAFPYGKGGIWARTSSDLIQWGPPTTVQIGGQAGPNWWNYECPQVHKIGDWYYLIHTQRYSGPPQSSVYRSRDPLDFGIDDDRCFVGHLPAAAPELFEHEGQWYIAALNPNLDGIRLAKLRWVKDE